MDSRAPRIDIELPVELTFPDSEEVYVGISVNLSESGVLVQCEVSRPRGSVLHFELEPWFCGDAEVIWTRVSDDGGALLGMRFQRLGRRARKGLEELLGERREVSSA